MRRDLARVHRRRSRSAVPADDLRRGDGALRQRQARPALRARARGRDRAHARLRLQGLRRRALRPLPAGAAGALTRGARRARGSSKGVGGKGARVPGLRRGGRGALADRQVPLRGGARRVRRRASFDRPLRRRRPEDGRARPRRAAHAPGRESRPDRREPVRVPLDHRLPDVRLVGGGRPLGRRPPPVHTADAGLGGALRPGAGRGDRPCLRPDRQRQRDRRRLVPDPRARAPGPRLRAARDHAGRAARQVRLPPRRARHGGPATRGDRVRDRSDGDGARRRAEPARRDRVPEETRRASIR